MTTRKVRPKQRWRPPSAADENAKAAAADMYRRGPDAPIIGTPAPFVMVKNDSGAVRRRGDVLYLDGTALLTAVERENIWIQADKLTNSTRNGILAVLLDPLPSGSIGPAQLTGFGVCYVNVIATWHRRAYPAASADVLKSGIFGPMELLSTPTATGEQLCFVTMGHSDNRGYFAKTTRDITAATLTSGRLTLGSGTVTIHDPYTTATQYANVPSHTVTVYNMAGATVAYNTFVFLQPSDDWLPVVTIEPCTAPE